MDDTLSTQQCTLHFKFINIKTFPNNDEILNGAYLMKLGWQLVARSNRLWARVLLCKCCKGKGLLHSKNNTLASLKQVEMSS